LAAAADPALSAATRTRLLIVLAIAAALLYAPNLADYFLGDDFDLIHSFYGKPPSYLLALLWSNESGDVWKDWGLDPAKGLGYLRPLKIWLLALDAALWGTNPVGFHVTATLCFVATAWMAARVLLEVLPGRPWIAVAGAGAAMLHPVFAEIVPLLTAREETLSTAFGLAALVAFMRSREQDRASPAFALLLALALLVKESAVAFVALAAGHDLVYVRMRPWRASFRRELGIWWPALAVLALYFALRRIAFGGFVGGDGSEPDYFSAQALRFHARLFASLADPTLLASASLPGGALLAALVFAAPIAAVAWCWTRVPAARRRDLLFVGPIWYAASVALYTGVPFATRHHVLPVLGLAMLESVALATLLDLGVLRGERRVAGAMLAAAALLFLPASIQTSREYRHASRVVEEMRGRIEERTGALPDGSRVLLRSVPQLDLPPYYFGWGLRSALGPPFTPSDVAGRITILNPRNLQLNNIAPQEPVQIDAEIDVRRANAIPGWMRARYVQRSQREMPE
jgi:hypothetical protein